MASKRLGDLRTHPEWVHHELLNWSRWCWLGPWPHPLPPQQCASLEGNYVRKNKDGSTDSVDHKPVHEERARIVQAVWDALMPINQQVMRAEYPQRFESGRNEFGMVGAARWLHISLREYEAALSVASYKVMLAFGENSR